MSPKCAPFFPHLQQKSTLAVIVSESECYYDSYRYFYNDNTQLQTFN